MKKFTLATQPTGYKQIMAQSLALYKASFTAKTILLSFLLSVCTFLPRIVAIILGRDLFYNTPLLSFHRLWILGINLISIALFIGLIWHLFCIIRGKHEPFMEDVKIGLRKTLLVILAAIVFNFIIVLAFLILLGVQILLHEYRLELFNNPIGILIVAIVLTGQFVLLLYVCALFVFFVPLIATENKGVISSLQRSADLVWNHWGKVLVVQFTPWLIYAFIVVGFQRLFHFNFHLYLIKSAQYLLPLVILHIVLFALFIPWVAATLLIQLKDLELRYEIEIKNHTPRKKRQIRFRRKK